MPQRLLILGCGYLGCAVGSLFRNEGWQVWGGRRSSVNDGDLHSLGIVPVRVDVTLPHTFDSLPVNFDAVINSVSSSRGGADVYRSVYWEGMVNILAWTRRTGVKRLLHTSSTSVYTQTDGSWVTELSAADPSGEAGGWLRRAEDDLLLAVRSGAIEGSVVRASGIYGPGRGQLYQQILRGEARLDNEGKRWLNMIHRDDLASALLCLMQASTLDEIYNANDDQPVRQIDFLKWLAEATSRPMPGPADPASMEKRKRGLTSKRVSNLKLRATGWAPKFPNFSHGYRALIHSGTNL